MTQRSTTLDAALVSRHAATLIERDRWTREQLLAHQRDRLRHSLRHAVDASPYYREKLGALVAREAPLSEFPILTKRELMANFETIVTDPRLTRSAIEAHLDGPDPGG